MKEFKTLDEAWDYFRSIYKGGGYSVPPIKVQGKVYTVYLRQRRASNGIFAFSPIFTEVN